MLIASQPASRRASPEGGMGSLGKLEQGNTGAGEHWELSVSQLLRDNIITPQPPQHQNHQPETFIT